MQVIYSYSVSTALELIVNPSSSTVNCGTNDNCTVICNATESCLGKTFYFYNNSVDIQCSASYACRQVKIFTSNVQSFTASMTGPKSFFWSTLYTSSTDINIHVQCGPSFLQACVSARFYYLNHGQSTHSCEGIGDCQKSMIFGISAVTLICKGSQSCFRTSFVLPTDETQNQQSSLTVYPGYSLTTATMKVYSLYPFSNFISADGTALDAIHFVYGMRFNQYCIVSDTSCMAAVATNIGSYDDEVTIINTYPDGIPSKSLSYNGDLLIFATIGYATFTPPSIPDTNTLSIVCLYCQSVTFELGGVQNAVLSDAAALLRNSNITGPSRSFELNIMHWSYNNKYFLQNTSTIVARSIGKKSEVYLGNDLDVHIQCPRQSNGSLYWKCTDTNIWSTLQRNEIHLAISTAGHWDLDTSYEFLIHFDFEEYPCTYIHYTSNCSFMTFHPTNNPSQSPTYNPSQNPSQQTGKPSSIPSAPPTMTPTHGGEQEVKDVTDTTDVVEPESASTNQSSNGWIVVVIAISLSVVIVCSATVWIVCYKKANITEEKTIQNVEATEGPSPQDKDMNMNQILTNETRDNKQETGNGECTTEGNGDADNVNIASDEFVIEGDDEIHDTIR